MGRARMMGLRTLAMIIACCLLTQHALGQAQAVRRPGELPSDEELRRELLGVLVHTRISATIDGAPVREIMSALSRALDVTIIGRYEDDKVGHGVDPHAPIRLRLDDVTALDALEMILDQAAWYEACTWQIRKGFIEVGTKRRLADVTDRRNYPMSDLLLEAPYFILFGQGPNISEFGSDPYRSASLRVTQPKFRPNPSGRGGAIRMLPQQLIEELIRAIAELVEPANWDFRLSKKPPVGPPPVRDGLRRSDAEESRPYRSSANRLARIRLWKTENLFVDAPDFFHRQIGGYGRPIPPQAIPDDVRGERSQRATADRTQITVLGVDPRGAGPRTVFEAMNDTSREREHEHDDAPPDDTAVGGAAVPDDRPPLIHGWMMNETFPRHAVGRLTSTRLSASFIDTPVREAIASLGTDLGLPFIGRFGDDRLGYGIDPETRITLDAGDVTALEVLEEIIKRCSTPEDPCTWQVRRGFIEVGTKARLSVPAARELRLHHIRDLMIDPTGGPSLPDELALQIVRLVVRTIEPDAWDWGQIDYYADEDEGVDLPTDAAPGRPGQPADAAQQPARPRPEYIQIEKPAIIRHWRDVLIVSAPDYIHRQIGGYPDSTHPK